MTAGLPVTSDGSGGFTLIEAVVTVAIVGILAAFSVARFGVAVETTRVDRSTAVLRTIFLAQRMYYMEYGTFANSLEALASLRLVENKLTELQDPFEYAIESATNQKFVARARRSGSAEWRGTVRIDEKGRISGSVLNREGRNALSGSP